jgi:D-3-phosphoglycerate dehydrogenase
MQKNTYLIIDFDSTIVGVESLDKLAEIVLKNHPQRVQIVEQIKEITVMGMEGKITFDESLKTRLALFLPTKSDIDVLIDILKQNISQSFLQNKNFLQHNKDVIYVISGGFREYIVPIIRELGLRSDHVFANNFLFDSQGRAVGYNPNNLLAKSQGKTLTVKSLSLEGTIIVVGDGFTDYEIVQQGIGNRFIAYTEYVFRPEIMEKSDNIASTFDDVLQYINRFGFKVY